MKQTERERAHHDRWAAEAKNDDVQARFDHFLALENRWIMEHLPPLAGLKVLDIGCGLGEASLFFARCGGHVTAVDVSEEMVKHTVEAARVGGVEVTGVVSSAEDLEPGDEKYAVIYMANVLHHLERPDDAIRKVAKMLEPDGVAFFMEPLKYNPVINIYRRMASKVRTQDESPVGLDILKEMRRSFGDVQSSTMWFLSLLIFLKYYFVDRVHPNDDRYWKRILKEPEATFRWMAPLINIDRFLCRFFPPFRYLCWTITIAARGPLNPDTK
jgi:2-polyprenyl-3-methyl-5-hydroxy-6-metoxy-1,4-benzoquinol methylase